MGWILIYVGSGRPIFCEININLIDLKKISRTEHGYVMIQPSNNGASFAPCERHSSVSMMIKSKTLWGRLCRVANRALRTICHKFLRSGGETSLNCLKFPQIRPSLREYSAGLKTCENSRKRTRLLPEKTHSENESEKSSPKKAKIESITKVIFRVVVRPSI